MMIRQVKEKQYEALQKQHILMTEQHSLEASFTMPMQVDEREYRLKIQLERHHKIAILQALEIKPCEQGYAYTLITDGRMLSSLMELLLWQKVL